MNHYVCSECGGVSHSAGTCQTDGCMQQGTPLKACKCEDGKHAGLMNGSGDIESSLEQPRPTTGEFIDLDANL
ncbi:hypothetical protein KW782_00945 [Candidatus Parcubacteria bacterium]|nr:hypothetical protein [Candidatus Parcubacteria bacterium]